MTLICVMSVSFWRYDSSFYHSTITVTLPSVSGDDDTCYSVDVGRHSDGVMQCYSAVEILLSSHSNSDLYPPGVTTTCAIVVTLPEASIWWREWYSDWCWWSIVSIDYSDDILWNPVITIDVLFSMTSCDALFWPGIHWLELFTTFFMMMLWYLCLMIVVSEKTLTIMTYYCIILYISLSKCYYWKIHDYDLVHLLNRSLLTWLWNVINDDVSLLMILSDCQIDTFNGLKSYRHGVANPVA